MARTVSDSYPAAAPPGWQNDPIVQGTEPLAPPGWENDPVVTLPQPPTEPRRRDAGELARAEIQRRQAAGIPLSPSEQMAIITAYEQHFAGGRPLQTFDEMAAQVRQATIEQNTALENLTGAAAESLARTGTGLVGTVAPGLGARLEEGLGYTYDPESRAAMAGQALGSVLTSVPAAFIPGGAFILAGSSAGNFRNEVVRRRLAGENITPEQELAGAVGYGLAEYLGERFGLGSIRRLSQAQLKGAIKDFLFQYAKAAGINASEELVTQIAQNAIDVGILDDEKGLMEGAGRAAAIGGIVGLVGGGAGRALQRLTPRPAGPVAPAVPTTPAPVETFPQAPAAPETPAPAPEAITPPPSQEIQAPPSIQRLVVKSREGDNKGQPILFESDIEKAKYLATKPGFDKKVVEDARKFLQDVGVPLPVTDSSVATKAEKVPVPNPDVRRIAEEYSRAVNIPLTGDVEYVKVDEARAKRIADWYEKGEHNPNDPDVRRSYDALKQETKEQYEQIVRAGYVIEPWLGEGPAYKNSAEMMRDIQQNKHLYFDPTDKTGFGQTEVPDHPMMEDSGVEIAGRRLLYNDLFRAVHDFFGHAKEGVGFGPRGEENAWRQHMQMYSDLAKPAMTTETRGQNSWVNFGPKGEQNRADPKNTVFAVQKAMLAPDWVVWDGAPAFRLRQTQATATPSPGPSSAPAPQRAPKPAPVSAAVAGTSEPRLPKALASATPRYGYQDRLFNLRFESDVDKAVYIASSKQRSKNKDAYKRFLKEAGYSERMISREGERLRKALNQMARDAAPDVDTLSVPRTSTAPTITFSPGVAERLPTERRRPVARAAEPRTVDAILREASARTNRPFTRAEPVTDEQREFAELFQSVLNQPVVFYRGAMSGFMSDGILFINVRESAERLKNVLAHELMHNLAYKRPGLFEMMRKALPQNVRDQALKDYLDAWRAAGQTTMPDRFYDEAVTVPFGDIAEGQNILRILRRESPSIWERVVRFFREIAAKLGHGKSQAWVQAIRTWESLLETPLQPVKGVEGVGESAFMPRATREERLTRELEKLSPEERALWDKLSEEERQWVRPSQVPKIMSAYRQVRELTSSDEWQAAIRAGLPMRKWYQRATAAIREIFGDDAPLFTAVLAASSPRQRVDKNLQEALRVWQAWDEAGRPNDPDKILEVIRDKVQMRTRIPNIIRALRGETLSGPKVTSFGQNLLGNLNFVTNDTWMAQFSGLPQDFLRENEPYLGLSLVVKEEAEKAGIEPAEAQAAVWSFFSVLANSVNSVTRGRDALARMTGEGVARARQFDFIADPAIRESIRQGGYSDDVIERAAKAAEAIVAVDEATGPKDISPEDRRALTRIADRAEKVARFPVSPEKVQRLDAERAGIEFSEIQLPALAELPAQEDDIPFAVGQEDRGPRPDLSLRAETREGRAAYVAEDVERKRRGEPRIRTDAEVEKAADDLVARGEAAIRELIDKAGSGQTFNDVETVAVRKFVDSILPKALADKDLTKVALIGELISADRKAGTEAGRAFRQRRDPVTPAQQLQMVLAEAFGTPAPDDSKTPDQAKKAEHLKRIRKYLEDNGLLDQMTPQNLADPVWVSQLLNELSTLNPDASKLYEYFLASILSGPLTQGRNLLGNIVNMTINQVALRPIEIVINQLVRSPSGPQLGEWKYIFRGMGPRIMAAFTNAIQTFRAERAVFQGRLVEGHVDLTKGPAIRGLKGRIIRTPMRFLAAVDQFMKTIVGFGEVGARAYREARALGMKPGSQEMTDYINKQIADLDSTAWKDAYNFARQVTFQDEPGQITAALLRLREADILGFRPLRYVVLGPFLRIAGKLELAAWEYTPLGTLRVGARAIRGRYRDEPPLAVQDLAKQVVAWSVFSTLWALTGSDDEEPWITGNAPKEAKDFAYRTAPPMSIRLPGYGWVSYKHLQPVSNSIATAIDAIDSIKSASKGKPADEAAGEFLVKAKNRFASQTFVQALGDFIDAMESEDKATSLLANFVASWVPNLIRQPTIASDDKIRENRTLGDTTAFDKIKRRALPGFYNALPRVTPWGDEVTKPGTALERMVAPFPRYFDEPHPVDRLVARYNIENPVKPYYVQVPTPVLRIGDEYYRMTEREYYLFLRASGRLASRAARSLSSVQAGKADAATMEAIEKVREKATDSVRDIVRSAVINKRKGNEERYRQQMDSLESLVTKLDEQHVKQLR